jgi:CheY-like chemotaxis protein
MEQAKFSPHLPANEEIVISGLKLLIADDSVTIQKVVELTFLDEGMTVASAGDGDQAIDKLEEFAPDVVLADVVMPGRTGYEVCEAIKQSERFHHIPVMLLVGSFEPFDEAEARRVGADDVLTKPFQSIRQLVNRVGTLLGGAPAETEATTRQLSTLGLDPGPRPESETVEPVAEPVEQDRPDEGADRLMDTDELELTTADTKPLEEQQAEPAVFAGDDLMPNPVNEPLVDMAEPFTQVSATADDQSDWAQPLSSDSEPAMVGYQDEPPFRVEPMDQMTEQPRASAVREDFDDVLLDLGDLDSAPAQAAPADSILELEEEPIPVEAFEPAAAETSALEPQATTPLVSEYESEFEEGWSDSSSLTAAQKYAGLDQTPVLDQPASADHQAEAAWEIVPSLISVDERFDEKTAGSGQASMAPQSEAVEFAPSAASAGASLSAAEIDAIARRVIEQMSEKVVREIAWEVVPELAELLIKRRLEEGNG